MANFDPNLITANPQWGQTQQSLAQLGTYNPYQTDLSNVDTDYRDRGLDLGEQSVQDQAQLQADQSQQDTQNIQQNLAENANSRGIAGSALADFQAAPKLDQAVQRQTALEGAAQTAAPKYRMERVNALKNQIVHQNIQKIDQDYQDKMKMFQRQFQQLATTTDYNVSNQIEWQNQKQQQDYQKAEAELNESLGLDSGAGDLIGTGLGALAGGIAGFFTGGPLGIGAGAQLGSRAGSALGRGISSGGAGRRGQQAAQNFGG